MQMYSTVDAYNPTAYDGASPFNAAASVRRGERTSEQFWRQLVRQQPRFSHHSLFESDADSPWNSLSFSPKITMLAPVPRFSTVHCAAACRPFGTSMPNNTTRHPRALRTNRTGKAFQLLPLLLIMTCVTFGPIIAAERDDRFNKLKNCDVCLL
jgi:hypothetical protein